MFRNTKKLQWESKKTKTVQIFRTVTQKTVDMFTKTFHYKNDY